MRCPGGGRRSRNRREKRGAVGVGLRIIHTWVAAESDSKMHPPRGRGECAD